MLNGRLAALSVFLCLLHLSDLATLTKRCSSDGPRQVRILLRRVQDLRWLDSRLYTPTMDDYQNCPRSTLRCLEAETSVLIGEWKTFVSLGRLNLPVILRDLADRFDQTGEAACRACELYQEEEAEIFLNRSLSILKLMNSEYCGSVG